VSLKQSLALTLGFLLLASFAPGLAVAQDKEVVVSKNVRYSDDFSDPKKVESDAEVLNNAKVFEKIGLSSANSGPGFVIWDLTKILPGTAEGAKVTLVYAGGANGPADKRGVTWSVSDDSKTWKDISVNQFDTPVEFQGRYLRASVRWVQAASAHYGFVKSFSIKAPAK
jgi:hypothetical protein